MSLYQNQPRTGEGNRGPENENRGPEKEIIISTSNNYLIYLLGIHLSIQIIHNKL